MAKTISLINMKGRVGKSTLTINLAWHFAAYEDWLKKVLVVDLDPQFNASQYLIGVERYAQMLRDENPTIWEIFEQHTKTPTGKIKGFDPKDVLIAVARIRGGGGIDLIPSRLELSLSLKNPAQKEYLLQRYLKKVESEYDIILIDCPPTESVFTISAYLASDYILVPVRPEYLSTIGLPLLVSSMRDFREKYAKQNPILCGSGQA
ncbi:AAA family ATPase [Desulfobacterales bacterium HSG2]|nr:AAA family ATPase [Desulfobacterales bacterium HSG2]